MTHVPRADGVAIRRLPGIGQGRCVRDQPIGICDDQIGNKMRYLHASSARLRRAVMIIKHHFLPGS